MTTSTLERLYREHHQAVIRNTARPSARMRDVAEDAAAHAFLQLALMPDERLAEPTVRAWLCVVARHEAYRLLRASAALHIDDSGIDPVDPTDIDTQLEARELLRAVAQLRPVRRRAITARLAGLSYHEAEQLHGVSYTNINRGTCEGRAELRELLS